MLAQVLANAVSLIDIAMVGRLGPDAVAAVGYATQFFFLSQSLLFAVGFACVALMARAIGAGDPDRARHALAASVGVAVAATLVRDGGRARRPRRAAAPARSRGGRRRARDPLPASSCSGRRSCSRSR